MRRYDDLDPFAQAFRSLRKAAGYTQESFAYEAGLDRGFVGAVERAERNVGFRKLRHLLIGLGINWKDWGAAMHERDPLPARAHSPRRSVATKRDGQS